MGKGDELRKASVDGGRCFGWPLLVSSSAHKTEQGEKPRDAPVLQH